MQDKGQKLYLERRRNENKFLSKLWEEAGLIVIRNFILGCSEGPRGRSFFLSSCFSGG